MQAIVSGTDTQVQAIGSEADSQCKLLCLELIHGASYVIPKRTEVGNVQGR